MPRDRRPPKKWWRGCKRSVRGRNRGEVCGRIWSNISPAKKRRIRRKREGFRKRKRR